MSDVWSWTNRIDGTAATIAATGTVAGFPATNIADPRIGRVWRHDGTAGSAITVTMAQPRAATVLGVFGGDMAPGGRWTVSLSTAETGAFEAVVTDHIPTIPEGSLQWIWWLEDMALGIDLTAIRRVRVEPRDAREVGRVWLGPADWTTSTGHILGSDFGLADLGSKQMVPRSGAIIPSRAAKRRFHSPRYDMLTGQEMRDRVRQMDRIAGATGQVLYLPDKTVYDTNEFAVLGYVDELNPIAAAGWDRYEREYTIRETG